MLLLISRCNMQDEHTHVIPPACEPDKQGKPATMTLRQFFGKARAHLLSVGIIRPAHDTTATDVNVYLSQVCTRDALDIAES